MRIHEIVAELHSMAADPDDTRIIAHAQYWADCAAALAFLREKGWTGSLLEIARLAPEATLGN